MVRNQYLNPLDGVAAVDKLDEMKIFSGHVFTSCVKAYLSVRGAWRPDFLILGAD